MLLKRAFSKKGILCSLNFVAKREEAYHGLAVLDEAMSDNHIENESLHDEFDVYCDIYNGSKQVAPEVMWVVKDVWWWSDIVSQLESKGS